MSIDNLLLVMAGLNVGISIAYYLSGKETKAIYSMTVAIFVLIASGIR